MKPALYTPAQRQRFEGCCRLSMAVRRAEGLWLREMLREFGPAFRAACLNPEFHRVTPALARLDDARTLAVAAWRREVASIEAMGSAVAS